MYWSCTTITTVGYGDITPKNDTDRIFVFFAMIFSTNLANIYTTSSLIGFLTNYSLGFIFSFFVTYIIPSVWVFFSLASDTHD